MDKEPTNTEILEAVNNLGTSIKNTDKHVSDVLEVINVKLRTLLEVLREKSTHRP